MVKPHLEIIAEILLYLMIKSVNTMIVLSKLLGELFVSLIWSAQTGFWAFLIAVTIGGVFIILMFKFLFKTGTSLLKIIAIYIIFLLILFFLIFFSY